MKIELVRPQKLAEDIVILDGGSRAGKTALAPVLSSFRRAELWFLDPSFEFFATLHHFGKMDRATCSAMLKLYADMDLYNQSIGRNTNFRKEDDSSAQRNGLYRDCLKKTKALEGDPVIRSIRANHQLLFLVTHCAFGVSQILFDAYRERLKLYLIMKRHPLWLVEGWCQGSWDKRIGSDPRDIQLVCRIRGKNVPWFAYDWSERYLSCGLVEQAIRTVDYFDRWFDRRLASLKEADRRKVLYVPFECYATDPRPYLKTITERLGTRETPFTRSILRKIKIPRVLRQKDYDDQKKKIDRLLKKGRVPDRAKRILRRLCRDYEKKYFKAWRTQ